MEIKLQDVHNNYVQLAVLQTRHPYVNWTNYINSQLPHEARVNSSELVVVASLDYLDHLGKVLSQTPDQVVANFMVLNVVARLISLKPNTTSDTAMDEKKCLQLTKQRYHNPIITTQKLYRIMCVHFCRIYIEFPAWWMPCTCVATPMLPLAMP